MRDRKPIPASWPPCTDHGKGEQHFGDIPTIIHQLGTAAELFSRRGDGNEKAHIKHLRHDRMNHYCDPQHHQTHRHGRPVGSGIGTRNDPDVKVPCCDEMEVHQVVERRVEHHRGVERCEVERGHPAMIEYQRGNWVSPYAKPPAAKCPDYRSPEP